MGTTTAGGDFVTPGRVRSVRAVVTWTLRLAGVGLTLFGVYLIGARLTFAGLMGDGVVESLRVHMGIATDHGVVRGVPMLAVGITLMVTARWIARWVVTMPDRGCPRCGYAGVGRDGACPECGEAGVGTPPVRDGPPASA